MKSQNPKIFVATNSHQVLKAIYLKYKLSESSRIIYISKTPNKRIIGLFKETIEVFNSYVEIKDLEDASSAIFFSIYFSTEVTKFFQTLDNLNISIILIQETHAFPTHLGTQIGINLTPDRIIAASFEDKIGLEKMNIAKSTNISSIGWIFNKDFFKYIKKDSLFFKPDNNSVLIQLGASSLISLNSAESDKDRIYLLDYINSRHDKKKYIKLHPLEKRNILKKLSSSFEFIDSEFQVLYESFHEIYLSAYSQTSIDAISSDIDFYMYAFSKRNRLVEYFQESIIFQSDEFSIFQLNSKNKNYIEFKAKFLGTDDCIDVLEKHLECQPLLSNKSVRRLEYQITKVYQNKKSLKLEIHGSKAGYSLSVIDEREGMHPSLFSFHRKKISYASHLLLIGIITKNISSIKNIDDNFLNYFISDNLKVSIMQPLFKEIMVFFNYLYFHSRLYMLSEEQHSFIEKLKNFFQTQSIIFYIFFILQKNIYNSNNYIIRKMFFIVTNFLLRKISFR